MSAARICSSAPVRPPGDKRESVRKRQRDAGRVGCWEGERGRARVKEYGNEGGRESEWEREISREGERDCSVLVSPAMRNSANCKNRKQEIGNQR